jgi:organic radical activating enzyme
MAHYHHLPNAVLGIYLSNRCNILCRHCGTQSGPKSKEVLSHQIIVSQLPQLIEGRHIRAVHVSGGEPFIYPAELRVIGDICVQGNVDFAINTNGFWGKTPDAASCMLTELSGITHLYISTDVYHEEFLPLSFVYNCCSAALEREINVVISICTPRGQRDSFVDRVAGLFQELAAAGLVIQITALELGGRANNLAEAKWREVSSNFPEGRCLQINKPVLLENGDVSACCNTEAVPRNVAHPLVIGNVRDDSLANILNRKAADELLSAIRLLGPASLADLLPPEAKQRLSGRYLQGLPCSICTDMLRDPYIVKHLRDLVSQPRMKVLMKITELALTDSDVQIGDSLHSEKQLPAGSSLGRNSTVPLQARSNTT